MWKFRRTDPKCYLLRDEKASSYISPGFLDIQVNGYMGSDYSLEDLSEEQIAKIIFHLSRSERPSMFPQSSPPS
jgi:N-acetylglucosamine-6-phosphate deacetylase